jgi:tryptophan synthase beta subunit
MMAAQYGLKVVLLSGDESWHSCRQIDYPAAKVQSLNVLRMRVLGAEVHPI